MSNDYLLSKDRDTFSIALGKIPSGCAILTVKHKDQSTGVLVSWIQQVSFEPLAISVCLKPSRPAASLVDGAECFLLNLIGDKPEAMFKHFGKGFGPQEDAFAGLTTEDTPYGPLIPDCIAHLACRVKSKVSAGDHDLYLADVVEGRLTPDTTPYVHLRKSGLSY